MLIFFGVTSVAEINQSILKNQNAKSSNAKLFIANSEIPKILSTSFDQAARWIRIEPEDIKKSSAAKKDQIRKKIKIFVSNKEKILKNISEKIENDLKAKFSESELKYLADQSANPLIKKLCNYLLSNELKRSISEPFNEANKIVSDSKK
ncbi:MAG: hypothetical protein H7256_16155 [Bdellovibrio sp.]|nr:hypothetical protein [Bdellovibrio sp.]